MFSNPPAAQISRLLQDAHTIAVVGLSDVFRRPEHIAGIVAECIRLRLPAIWLVMDRCLFKDRAALR